MTTGEIGDRRGWFPHEEFVRPYRIDEDVAPKKPVPTLRKQMEQRQADQKPSEQKSPDQKSSEQQPIVPPKPERELSLPAIPKQFESSKQQESTSSKQQEPKQIETENEITEEILEQAIERNQESLLTLFVGSRKSQKDLFK